VALGDWGRRGSGRQRAVANAMATAAKAAASRFVISVGDNFYENGVQSATDDHWKASFEDVYAAALQTPWYAVLGNHDHRGSAQAQVDYARASPRWRMPGRFYRVSGAQHGAPQLDLFFLDTTALVLGYSPASPPALQRAAAAQLGWLDAELGRSRAAWKLVVGHHPVHSGGSGHGDTPALVAKVKPLLDTHGVQAYLNGHDHNLQHVRRGSIDYVGTGAESAVRAVRPIEGTRFCLARPGFALFSLGAETLTLEFRDFTGASLYRTALPRLRA
jgi:tartrate-resistant acid phosphatase type 5